MSDYFWIYELPAMAHEWSIVALNMACAYGVVAATTALAIFLIRGRR